MAEDFAKELTTLKIGVLTFHRCINYGSYWQALCLVDGLRERGHDAVLLDHYSRRVNLAEWRCAFRPVLPTHVPPSDYSLYKEKTRKFFAAFATMPQSERFPLDNPAGMESFDAVVVGSDEVWNLNHPWYGRHPLFYGAGLNTKRLISYAASFGNYPAAVGLPQAWADKLRRFDLISVRDDNSRLIIENALGVAPEIVADPCLQFFPRQHAEFRQIQEQGDNWGPYMALYGHNFSHWFKTEARRWASDKGYKLVSIGYRNDWADEQWLTAGPEDFARFIAGAQAVVTNFFHGCVFSLVNEKPFVCEKSDYRSIKVRDLMRTIGGEQHLVAENTPFSVYDQRLSEPIAPAILANIKALRQRSDAFLDKALRLNP